MDVLLDPVEEVAGLGVHPRIARVGTAIAPRHNAGQLIATHEGSSGITLARVLPSGLESGAHHGVNNVTLSIHFSAVVISDNWNFNLLELVGNIPAFGSSSPARHCAHAALLVLLMFRGQINQANVIAQGGLVRQLEQTDVVLDGAPVVVRVKVDVLDLDVLLVLVLVVHAPVANAHRQGVSVHPVTAMSGGDNPLWRHQGSSAHEGAVDPSVQHGHLVRELSVGGHLA